MQTLNNLSKKFHRTFNKKNLKKVANFFKRPHNYFVIFLGLFLVVISISYLWVVYYGFITSLKSLNNFAEDMFGFPRKIVFYNYEIAWTRLFYRVPLADGGYEKVYFPRLFLNTLLISVPPVVITLFTQCIVSYVCSKYRFAFNHVLHLLVVFVFVMPSVNALGQKIMFLKAIGFYDNYWALLYGCIIFADYNFLIFYGAWKGISSDYMDAARIDGAGHFYTYFYIMFPLVRTQFLVLFFMGFLGKWKDYMQVMTTMPSWPVLSLALLSFQWDTTTIVAWPTVQMAASMIVAIPCIVLYLFIHPILVGNLTFGGLKA